MTTPTDDWTLGATRDWLRAHADHGTTCPCCTQFTKVYRRKMTSVSARTMITMYALYGHDWANVPALMRDRLPDIAHQGGYATLGQHWGLIEESPDERADGGRAGWWRLTDRGMWFVTERLMVPKYARLFDARCLGYAGDPVSIGDVLGDGFDLDDLMRGQ